MRRFTSLKPANEARNLRKSPFIRNLFYFFLEGKAMTALQYVFNVFLIFAIISSFLFVFENFNYKTFHHRFQFSLMKGNVMNYYNAVKLRSGLKENLTRKTDKYQINISIENAKPVSSKHKSNNVDVLLVGQARSGTTFLGELFNQHQRFAYVFEPLWTLAKLLKNNIFYEKEIQEYRKEISSTLESFLTCNFTGKEIYLRKLISKEAFFYHSKFLQTKAREKMQGNFSKAKTFYEKGLCSFEHRAIKILSGRISNVSLLSLK